MNTLQSNHHKLVIVCQIEWFSYGELAAENRAWSNYFIHLS